jgi:hypothetical protein
MPGMAFYRVCEGKATRVDLTAGRHISLKMNMELDTRVNTS